MGIDPLKSIDDLKKGIEGLIFFQKLFGNIWHTSKYKVLHRIREPFRVLKLSDDIFSKKLDMNSNVTVQGKLVRYSQTYKPTTYMPQLLSSANIKRTPINFFETREEVSLQVNTFQLPVQVIPPILNGEDKYEVAFLYPSEFESFISPENSEKRLNNSDNFLNISQELYCIPVLLPYGNLDNLAENEVKITGVISKLPIEIINNNLLYEDMLGEFAYGYCRPTNPHHIAFCLDCRDSQYSDFSVIRKLPSLAAAIYLEGHFENISYTPEHIWALKNAIPNGAALHVSFDTRNGNCNYPTEHEKISVVGNGLDTFGFYMQVDLLNTNRLDKDLRELKTFQNTFSKQAEANFRALGNPTKFKPDFLFDYRRQKFFHPDGVLVSEKVKNIVRDNPSLEEGVNWIRNSY